VVGVSRIRRGDSRTCMPGAPRRVGPAGPHARRMCGGRGGAQRRRLDQIRLNLAAHFTLQLFTLQFTLQRLAGGLRV
jgi:hypothetical protein